MSDAIDPDDEVRPPDQAVLEESDHVVPLPRNRYLVSTSTIDDATAEDIKSALDTDGDTEQDEASTTDRPALDAARETIVESLRTSGSMYTIEFAAVLEGTLHTDRIETHDVVEAFEDLNERFATGIGDDSVSTVEVIDILLAESDLGGSRRTHNLEDVLDAYGLAPSDSIADLIEAAESDH